MSSSSNSIEEQSSSRGFKQLKQKDTTSGNNALSNLTASLSPVVTNLPPTLQLGVKLPKSQLTASKYQPQAGIFYKECPKHRYKVLDAVCLDSKCKRRTIICAGCKEDVHRGHKTIHLRDFLDNMKDRASGASKSILIDGSLETIKGLQRAFGEEIARVRQSFERILQDVERKTSEALNKAESEFSNSNNLDFQHRSMLDEFNYDHADEDLEDHIAKVVDGYLFLEQQPKKLEDHLQNCKAIHVRRMQFLREMTRHCENIGDGYVKIHVKDIKEKIKDEAEKENEKVKERGKLKRKHEIDSSIDDQIEERENQKERSIITRPTGLSSPMSSIVWSTTLKHPDIDVNGLIVRRLTQSNSNFVGVFANRIINIAPPFVHTWTIKIRSMTQDINIGVCEESYVISRGYIDDDYLTDTKSLKESCPRMRNKKPNKFTSFTKGDVVRLSYNTIDNVLTYTKMRGESKQSHSIDCQDVAKGLNLRPYVSLMSVGDSVEILPE